MPTGHLHEVTLNYAVDTKGSHQIVKPPAIKVAQGHQIRFKRGAIPPDTTATIIFTEPQFFSSPVFDEGDPDIEVVKHLPHRTFYKCGLKGSDRQLIPGTLSGPSDGGDIDPVGGNAGN